MEYLRGSKEEFLNFLAKLNKKDKIGVITHIDLDGIASAILINEILKQKKLKINSLSFINYEKGMFKLFREKFSRKRINKVFIFDINVDSDYEGFFMLKKKYDIFLIDHHPSDLQGKNIIKTKSEDCTTLVLYDLLKKEFNIEKWKELVLATAISEFSFSDKENFQFIKEAYSLITLENIWDSIPVKEAEKIGFALIYFKRKEKKVFNLLQKQKQKLFDKYYNIIKKEVIEYEDSFRREAEFYPEKNLYLFYKTPKYHLISLAINKLALETPEKTIVCLNDSMDSPEFLSASFRNQLGKENVNLLVKKAINGLENANGGGHVPAAAARFLKKDLEKFKENILK